MGFGHRVYKNYDPRARRSSSRARTRSSSGSASATRCWTSPRPLEEKALADDYFIERKLYPNVDFYTGVIYRAMGFPTRMFTVLFALGRLPGWIAHWREMINDPTTKIGRPRQLYVGETERILPGALITSRCTGPWACSQCLPADVLLVVDLQRGVRRCGRRWSTCSMVAADGVAVAGRVAPGRARTARARPR